ncbi:MAG: hypothetical protein ACFB2Z_06725 [Maricaulaceae bacterium]
MTSELETSVRVRIAQDIDNNSVLLAFDGADAVTLAPVQTDAEGVTIGAPIWRGSPDAERRGAIVCASLELAIAHNHRAVRFDWSGADGAALAALDMFAANGPFAARSRAEALAACQDAFIVAGSVLFACPPDLVELADPDTIAELAEFIAYAHRLRERVSRDTVTALARDLGQPGAASAPDWRALSALLRLDLTDPATARAH